MIPGMRAGQYENPDSRTGFKHYRQCLLPYSSLGSVCILRFHSAREAALSLITIPFALIGGAYADLLLA